jgi:hypothetical protein
VVAESLSDLRGPAAGRVELPLRLFWSGPDRTFNLDLRYDALAMYQAVLGEARQSADLAEHLNADLLASLWPQLHLPAEIRQAWETAHPRLRSASASAA